VNKQLRDEWVKALRSGEYEQARGTLSREMRTGRSYCCLGVLVRVIDGDDSSLEPRCRTSNYGLPVNTDQYLALLDLNDNQQRNFPAIADWIEANVPAEET
jgi:hypothetical protein